MASPSCLLVSFSLNFNWLQEAQKAYDKIKDLPPKERAKAINDRSRIWKKLKEPLQECSHGKCWYCESRETTAPGDVDHFRPKNEVEECPNHPGYWWLAFDWTNYRYACELCNRPNNDPATERVKGKRYGGKGIAFPLVDPNRRVFDENAIGGVLCEEPELLNPVVASDPLLLTFDEDGTTRPAKNQAHYPKEYKRAETSINVYHLNRAKLKNARRFYVCRVVAQLVKEGDEFLLLGAVENSVAARQGYNKVVERLSLMIDGQAQYSAAARAVLKMYRNREWVDDLLTAS